MFNINFHAHLDVDKFCNRDMWKNLSSPISFIPSCDKMNYGLIICDRVMGDRVINDRVICDKMNYDIMTYDKVTCDRGICDKTN